MSRYGFGSCITNVVTHSLVNDLLITSQAKPLNPVYLLFCSNLQKTLNYEFRMT